MAHLHVLAGSDASPTLPDVRRIEVSDLKDALAKGIDDFWAFPTHVIFLSIIYPIVGLLLAGLTLSYDVLPLLFPAARPRALAPKSRGVPPPTDAALMPPPPLPEGFRAR